MEQIIYYTELYAYIALGTLLLTAVVAGYIKEDTTWASVVDAIFWPVKFAELFGIVLLLIQSKLSNKLRKK